MYYHIDEIRIFWSYAIVPSNKSVNMYDLASRDCLDHHFISE